MSSFYLLNDTGKLLSSDGTTYIKKVPLDYKFFIKQYYPEVKSEDVIDCRLITKSYCGGKLYITIGLNIVIWIKPKEIGLRFLFNNLDDLNEYLKLNGFVKPKK
jgi:hypothetical protein